METTKKTDLTALDRAQLEAFATERGLPAFRGRQLWTWVHGHGVRDFDRMTNLPAAFRARLAAEAELPALTEVTRQQSQDGTIKFLFELPSGRRIESVLIPDLDAEGAARRLTVCVSSQVGCAMGCSFCATGQMGFYENLTAGAITDQVRLLDVEARERWGRGISNVVFMGMGEPLQNLDAVLKAVDVFTDPAAFGLGWKRVTVSTVGLARRIREVADRGASCRLAISLHSPIDEKRSAIMPVNRSEKTDLGALEEAVRYYHQQSKKQVTYEYCLFEGFNDSDEDAVALARVAYWAPSKINIILYNSVPELGFRRTDEKRLDRFVARLVKLGVTVTVRRSRGQDIAAACGQLAVAE